MKIYKGSCHCGQVQFEVITDLTKAMLCNCSICTKKGALHHRVPPERFKLISGQDVLALYQFDSRVAKHWFCKVCGIHPFTNPLAAPEMFSINVHCLDDCDDEKSKIEIKAFDGKNWEAAIKSFEY
jgi:hypothetical protein